MRLQRFFSWHALYNRICEVFRPILSNIPQEGALGFEPPQGPLPCGRGSVTKAPGCAGRVFIAIGGRRAMGPLPCGRGSVTNFRYRSLNFSAFLRRRMDCVATLRSHLPKRHGVTVLIDGRG